MASKTIGELKSLTENGVKITGNADLMFAAQCNGTAYRVTGDEFVSELATALDGHGGIKEITGPKTSGIIDTYTITYADGNDATFTVTNGTNGISSTITSTTVTYQASASGTTPPTGEWLSSPPEVAEGQYLWTKSYVLYSTGASYTAYSVGYHGEKGDKGEKGNTGDAAGFGTVTATVDATGGEPSVEVTASGADTAKNFAFAFHNLEARTDLGLYLDAEGYLCQK